MVCFSALSFQAVTDRSEQTKQAGMGTIARPVNQKLRLDQTESERWSDILDECGDQDTPLEGLIGFDSHPMSANGNSGPQDNDAAGGRQLAFNDLIPHLPRSDLRIPPHRPAAILEHPGELLGLRAILASITDEHLCHF